jgi:hypothetical protein
MPVHPTFVLNLQKIVDHGLVGELVEKRGIQVERPVGDEEDAASSWWFRFWLYNLFSIYGLL